MTASYDRWHVVAGVAALILLAARPAAAGPGAPLSLAAALREALHHNPSLQRAREVRLAARARVRSARSAGLPHLGLEALGKDGPPGAPALGLTGLASSVIVHRVGADVVLSQLLYDAGRSRHLLFSARHAADAAGSDEDAARARVALEVTRAYAAALEAQHRLDALQRSQQARRTALRAAELRLAAGLASRVDVDLARLGEAAVRQSIAEGQSAYRGALATLNATLGRPPESPLTLQDLAPENAPLPSDPARALARRPEVRGLRSLVAAADEDVRSARAARGPALRGFASGGWLNTTPADAGANHTYAVGVSLTVPLYTGGRLAADIDAAAHARAALRQALVAEEQQVALEVTRARLALAALEASREAVADRVTQARDFAALARKRYRAGFGGILEVQEAQVQLLEAETAAVRLRYRTVAARAELRWATGDLLP